MMAESNLQELKLEKERFKRKPLRIEVYEFLKESITRGGLKPGQKLNEVDLGNHLGISRTPIREALMRLEHEGLVTLDPGKGAVVSEISKVDLGEIYPIVAALEGLAARIAAANMEPADIRKLRKLDRQMVKAAKAGDASAFMNLNTEFHQTFLDRCTNQRLSSLVSSYKEQIYRFRIFSLNMPGRMHHSTGEHRQIIEAFERKDGELAEQLLRNHVEQGRKTLEKISDVT